jgi:hypothetical protein
LDPEEYAPLVSLFAIAALRPLPLQSVTVLVAGTAAKKAKGHTLRW